VNDEKTVVRVGNDSIRQCASVAATAGCEDL